MYKYSTWIGNEGGATYNIIMDNKPQIMWIEKRSSHSTKQVVSGLKSMFYSHSSPRVVNSREIIAYKERSARPQLQARAVATTWTAHFFRCHPGPVTKDVRWLFRIITTRTKFMAGPGKKCTEMRARLPWAWAYTLWSSEHLVAISLFSSEFCRRLKESYVQDINL